MKKLVSLTLLLLSLWVLQSCSSDDDDNTGGGSTTTFDDWNDPKSPNYKPNGYNPIEGEWVDFPFSYGLKLIFTSDFQYKKSYYENGVWLPASLLSTYKINNTTFKTDKKIPYSQDKIDTFPYKLGKDNQGDYIDITYPQGTVRYYKLK